MCGFLGVIQKNVNLETARFKEALSLLRHRGPDNISFVQKNNYILGHARLSIIDLNERSNQPMVHLETQTTLLFNGEFYNFKEIREELLHHGVNFKTDSDTEVFLKAYDFWGISFIKKVNGFFSAVIVDKKNNETYLIRDPYGIKPLYYYKSDDSFIFSSEIKPILHLIKSYQLNEKALFYYFSYRYNLLDETMFSDVFRVPHGSYIKFKNSYIEFHRYWDIKDALEKKPTPPLHQRLPSLISAFKDAVEKRLVSDTPLGIFLSAGIDSNSIATFASDKKPDLESYSIKFNGAGDEASEITQCAKHIHISNSQFESVASYEDLQKAIFHLEEPLGDTIIIPTYQIAREVSKENKVVLSGEGADEILNGYVHHVSLAKEERLLKFIPKIFIEKISRLIALLPQAIAENLFPYPDKLGKKGLKKLIKHFQYLRSDSKRVRSLVELFFEDEFDIYFQQSFKIRDEDHEIEKFYTKFKELAFLDKLTLQDLTFWNPNYTLQRLDKLTMANSLEARVPFLDPQFSKLILSLPTKMNKESKYVQREILRAINSNHPALKNSKTPFYFPVSEMTQQGIKTHFQKIMSEINFEDYPYLKKSSVVALINKEKWELIEGKQMMSFVIFFIWHQLYFSNKNLLSIYDGFNTQNNVNIKEKVYYV